MTSLSVALAGYLAFGQLVPGEGTEIVRHAGLQVVHADGTVTLRLAETGRSEVVDDGGRTISIDLKDDAKPFFVTRHIRIWNDCDVVETWIDLRHDEHGPLWLLRADSFAAPIDYASETVSVLSLSGAWANDANLSEALVGNGQTVELSSKTGTRSAWESNAAMMVLFGDGVTEESGAVLGLALEWSGTNCRRVRRSWDGKKTEVFAGVDMTTGPYVLDPGRTFTTPRAVLVWCDKGRGEVSRQLHRWACRHCLPHGRDLRSVLLNSWEGAYYSFTEKTLNDMMNGASQLGAEMFVVDDGWFGSGKYARDEKNAETAGLGDWQVNRAKLPHGLEALAVHAKNLGLGFGLWVEPEMVNTNSWFAEAHPDWMLCEKDRQLATGRGGTQVVLDYVNPAVRDAVFNLLDRVYADVPCLSYVKWDCNSNIANPGSGYLPKDRQSNLWYDYTTGLYELLARFQSKRPSVIVQACASGGGRMDYGFLRYADEFWTSDCTDPLRRIFLQWSSSMFYPACAMACHVSASPNHQTKRETPLKYRFDVAMCGRLGLELDPKSLSHDELTFAKQAVADYKRIRPTVQQGNLWRLASPFENRFSSLMYVDAGSTNGVVFVLGLDCPIQGRIRIFPRGLDPSACYAIREICRGERAHSLNGDAIKTGADLMSEGICLSLDKAYDSAVFSLARVNGFWREEAGIRKFAIGRNPETSREDSQTAYGMPVGNRVFHIGKAMTIDEVNKLAVCPGDQILFERGGVWRGQLQARSGRPGYPVVYGAYGEGEKPVIQASCARNSVAEWRRANPVPCGKGVWMTDAGECADIGNIMFLDEGASVPRCGYKKCFPGDVIDDLDFWCDPKTFEVYVKCEKNPAERFKAIELCETIHCVEQWHMHDIVYDGLCLRYTGAHGFAGGGTKRITIRNCDLCWIGGGYLYYDKRGNGVRFGNGIEFWGDCEDILVEKNRLWEIWDAALTNQSNDDGAVQRNIVWCSNEVWNCEYSYEYWQQGENAMTENVVVEGNVFRDAGFGWGHGQRWNPNAAHLMFYDTTAKTTNFVVKGNMFLRSKNTIFRLFNDWRGNMTFIDNKWDAVTESICRFHGRPTANLVYRYPDRLDQMHDDNDGEIEAQTVIAPHIFNAADLQAFKRFIGE